MRSGKRQRKTEKSSNLVAFKVSMVAKRQRRKGNPAKSDAFTAGKKQKRQRKTEKSSKYVVFLSNYCGSYLYTGKREKHKICKKCLRKIKLSFIIIYMEIVTKIKGIYYEGRKGYDEKKNT